MSEVIIGRGISDNLEDGFSLYQRIRIYWYFVCCAVFGAVWSAGADGTKTMKQISKQVFFLFRRFIQ